MDSERIPGSGIEHEQNYIQERMINASDVDELGEQNEKLKDELRDLNGASSTRSDVSSSNDALKNVANEPTVQSDVGSQARTNASVGPTDAEQLPPISSARSQVVNDAGGGQIGS